MDFKEMIEAGAKKAGTARKLSDLICVTENNISSAKSPGRGLPDKACVKLAQLLEIDALKVIAARNEWTAKTEEDKEFWHPLANAAAIAGISVAIVTSFLMPSPAQAAQDKGLAAPTLCIM